MTLFWILTASLTAVALACILIPLLKRNLNNGVSAQPLNVAVYRDQQLELEADHKIGALSDEQYEHAKLDLQRRLLSDAAAVQAPATAQPARKTLAMAMALAVPLMAVGLYFAVGNPGAIVSAALPAVTSNEAAHQQIDAMVTKLAARMKENPDDPQGWAMLAKSYSVMGRFEDAVAAYAKSVERAPHNANVLADYADALAMTRGQSLLGEPEALVARALQADPDHIKSLALAGTVAFDKKDYMLAIKHWEKLATRVEPDSEMARGVQTSLAEARGLAGIASSKAADKPLASQAVTATLATAAAASNVEKTNPNASAGLSGTIALSPEFAAKVAPTDTVFIFARAVEGSRMPLAILRKKVSDLPITFVLDDSMAMSPVAILSGTAQVIVGARVSKSGDAMPLAGDLQGFSQPVKNSAKDLAIIIDAEVR